MATQWGTGRAESHAEVFWACTELIFAESHQKTQVTVPGFYEVHPTNPLFVTEKNKIWLHVGLVLLTSSSHCFLFTKRILSIHNDLPRGTLALCLNVKPKCLFSWRHLGPAHLWIAARKKTLTHLLHSHSQAGHSGKYLNARLMTFLLCFLTPPPSPIYKRTWHPDPFMMVILRH